MDSNSFSAMSKDLKLVEPIKKVSARKCLNWLKLQKMFQNEILQTELFFLSFIVEKMSHLWKLDKQEFA